MRSWLKPFIVFSFFAPQIAAAAESPLSYNSLSAGYHMGTVKFASGTSVDLTGFQVDGSLELGSTAFITGSFLDTSGKVSGQTLSADVWSLGVGGRFPLAATTELAPSLRYVNQQVNIAGTSTSKTGYGIGVDFRHLVSEEVELFGGAGVG